MAETITAKTTKEAAPKKLTIAEILAQRKAFEEQIAAQLAEERPAALDAVKGRSLPSPSPPKSWVSPRWKS